MSRPLPPIRPADLLPHWRRLALGIGERRAGSEAEHRAAQYLLQAFRRAGVDEARLEAFECNSQVLAQARLEVRLRGRWRSVPCQVLVNSPSTRPEGRPIERELVWVEMPEEVGRLRPGALRGKALLLFGPLATNALHHAQLVRSGASLVLWVDDRLPFEWPKADGLLPLWVSRHGALPTLSVAFRTAYEWRGLGVTRIRAQVLTRHERRVSYNVVAEVQGRDPGAGLIALGAHHDTQVGNAGADDNGSGVVSLLALAQRFARCARQRRLSRTLRFISFGCEEQLSVGSRAYVLEHRAEMDRHLMMVNIDSASSSLAHTLLLVAGRPEFERWAVGRLQKAGLPFRISREVTPFSDHFPFNTRDVPALWFFRANFPGGRWQHHSVHDTLRNLSPEALCRILNALLPLLAGLAGAKKIPFERGMRTQDRAQVRRFAKELFGL